MKTLYIIGNGFDRAHGLETSYWDFRTYLKDNAEEFLENLEHIYGFYPINDDHLFSASALEAANKARDALLYNKLWETFEYGLGHPDESDIESTCYAAIDAMKDIEFGGIEDTLNQYFEKQFKFIEKLQTYLFDWVLQISVDKAEIMRDFNDDDLFLTFNYTPVLEKIYQIDSSQICHIHGGIPPYCLVPPQIGHGNKKPIEQREKWIKECVDLYDEGGASLNRAFANFYKRTLKDTDRYLNTNKHFFNKAGDMDEVQIIGHSLGEVDMPYFRELPDDIPWTVFYRDNNDKDTFEKRIREIGATNITVKTSDEFWK